MRRRMPLGVISAAVGVAAVVAVVVIAFSWSLRRRAYQTERFVCFAGLVELTSSNVGFLVLLGNAAVQRAGFLLKLLLLLSGEAEFGYALLRCLRLSLVLP